MAGFARASEVVEGVGSSVFEWEDVVDFFDGCVASLLEAVFTQRVLGDVGGADLAPASAVAFGDGRVALVALVVAVVLSLMLAAEPVKGEGWAAGLRAWRCWLLGHARASPVDVTRPHWPLLGWWGLVVVFWLSNILCVFISGFSLRCKVKLRVGKLFGLIL